MINIAIFASGTGSNAVRICEYFKNHSQINICAVFCNNPKAGIITKMSGSVIPLVQFTRSEFYESTRVEQYLEEYKADYIVLAGFLWLIPQALIEAYPQRIINIHPALLPKFGGKGMYGKYVHQAVVAAGEKESGITIHLADRHYDEGKILKQVSLELQAGETPESLAMRINKLELEHYAPAIERYILEKEH